MTGGQPDSRGSRPGRFLRAGAILFAIGLAAAILLGLWIGARLTGGLYRWAGSAAPVTPLPMAQALAGVHSLRASFSAETAGGALLLSGDAIVVAAPDSDTPDFYLSWEIIDPPAQAALLLVDGRLYARDGPTAEWTPETDHAGDVLGILHGILPGPGGLLGAMLGRLSGISLSADMPDWEALPDGTLDGRPVRRYGRSDLSVTLWRLLLPEYASIFEGAQAEIAIGQRDNLPYLLRYTLNLGAAGSAVTDALILTIRLYGFNDPVRLAIGD